MSSGMIGADVAQLRELARQLQAASDELNGARRRVGSEIRVAAWIGPVAVRFRLNWDSQYSREVQAASDALETIANALDGHADEQERASAPSGGNSSGGPGGGVQRGPFDPSNLLPFPIEDLIEWPPRFEKIEDLIGIHPRWMDLDYLADVLGGLDEISEGLIPGVGFTSGTIEYIRKIVAGQATFEDFTDYSADVVGLLGPIGEIGGIAIDVWARAGREALNMDFAPKALIDMVVYGATHPVAVMASAAEGVEGGFSTINPINPISFAAGVLKDQFWYINNEIEDARITPEGVGQVIGYAVRNPGEAIAAVGDAAAHESQVLGRIAVDSVTKRAMSYAEGKAEAIQDAINGFNNFLKGK